MNKKHLKSIAATVCLGFSAFATALAQPVITAQPTSQFLSSGQNALFSVSATGTAPITYQWQFDGTAVAGATSRALGLPNPKPAKSGYYSVIVSNAFGCVTSQVAELKVFVAAAHSLSGIQTESNASVSLSFSGETTALFASYYDQYPLEASSDLVNWSPLATMQRSNAALNTLNFLDTNAPMFNQRFYRTPTNQLATPDPQPTGPYSVGTFSMLLTNIYRTNAQFMVTFWYPAVAQAGVLPAKYVDPQIAVPPGNEEYAYYNFGNVGGVNWDNQAAAFYSHSLSNGPLATNPVIFPVVLYDSGGGGHRRENTDKAEELASWGYVVVGLDTSDTSVSVFPNGTVVDGQTIDYTTAFLGADLGGRVLDMQSLLDELAALNASDPRLGGRLNLNEVGALGWSLGGGTVAELCQRDPRCKAGVFMEPFGILGTNLQSMLTQPLNVPVLFFRSDAGPDPVPGWYVQGDGRPDNRFEIYNEQVTNAYWVRLASTVHGSFADYELIVNSAAMETWSNPLNGQILPLGRASQIVRAYLLSFFNKFLQGQDDHLLDGPSPAYPEVMQFLSTDSNSVAPAYPAAALVQANDGSFYGTTAYGGTNGLGTVFQVTTNGALTTLVSFKGTNGSHPVAALVLGSDGNFYGTTKNGGTNGNNGTVFQMTPAGTLMSLVSFNGTNGNYPSGALVQGTNGNFYGTTLLGGSNGFGTVFEMTYAGLLTTLFAFHGTDGISPLAALEQGSDGNLYGTTGNGGSDSQGTAFKMTPAGSLMTHVSFSGAVGTYPAASLVQGTNGYFYGTTAIGGNLSYNAGSGLGTVFRMIPSGPLATVVEFTGNNGSFCASSLLQSNDGNFYGTTEGGGTDGGGGTVFKMTYAGVLTTLVSFNGGNGSSPAAGLVQGTDGNFYGTTEYGGANGLGTVFQVTPTGVLTTLVSF